MINNADFMSDQIKSCILTRQHEMQIFVFYDQIKSCILSSALLDYVS